jgi:hypothetical protein
VKTQQCVSYLQNEWLKEGQRERLVEAWTNQYLHFGIRVTSRAEGAHAYIKRYLGLLRFRPRFSLPFITSFVICATSGSTSVSSSSASDLSASSIALLCSRPRFPLPLITFFVVYIAHATSMSSKLITFPFPNIINLVN